MVAICMFPDCGRRVHARKYCAGHYQQLTKYGGDLRPLKWKRGFGSITDEGYLRRQINGKQIYQHRIVMEEHLGRKLTKEESVHHKNGDRLDNRLENLELWSRYQPAGQRVEEKIAYAKEILKLYQPEALIDN